MNDDLKELLDNWFTVRHDDMYVVPSLTSDPFALDFICRSVRRPIANEN